MRAKHPGQYFLPSSKDRPTLRTILESQLSNSPGCRVKNPLVLHNMAPGEVIRCPVPRKATWTIIMYASQCDRRSEVNTRLTTPQHEAHKVRQWRRGARRSPVHVVLVPGPCTLDRRLNSRAIRCNEFYSNMASQWHRIERANGAYTKTIALEGIPSDDMVKNLKQYSRGWVLPHSLGNRKNGWTWLAHDPSYRTISGIQIDMQCQHDKVEISETPELGFEGTLHVRTKGMLSSTNYSRSRQNAVVVG